MTGWGLLAGALATLGVVLALGQGLEAADPAPFQPDWSRSRHATAPASAALAADVKGALLADRSVFVLCNVDDDDRDRRADRDDHEIDGDADADDLTHVVLTRLGAATTDEIGVRLAPAPASPDEDALTVRVFDTAGRVRLGRDADGDRATWDLSPEDREALATGDVSLYVEGLTFGATETLEVLRDGEVTDRITLRVSPLQLSPSIGEPADIIHAFLEEGIDSWADAFVEALDGALDEVGLDASKRTRIPLNSGSASDWWIQDQLQWAYTETPDVRLPIAVLLPRRGYLQGPCTELLGPDLGSCVPVPVPAIDEPLDGQLYGGNLEVFPATGVSTPGCVYGGFLRGPTAAAQQVEADPLEQSLARASLQCLVGVDTTLTYVGHVDEFLAFVPPAIEGGKTYLLVASPGVGVSELDDPTRPAEAPDVRIQKEYASLPEDTNQEKKTTRWEDILATDVNGLGTMTLRTYNQALGKRIHGDPGTGVAIYAPLVEHLASVGVECPIIRVPTLFRPSPLAETIENGYEGGLMSSAMALVPNMVNLIAFPGHVITADPTVARFVEVLEEAFQKEEEDAYVRVHPIDVFDLLHKEGGGIHCATNVRYEPTGLHRWWEPYR